MLGEAQGAVQSIRNTSSSPSRCAGSDIPVQLMYVEMIDGVYAPIGLRTPPGQGPFPLVLFASGNGGGGMAVVRDFTQNVSWTQEQFLKAGYAVAWMRYRAEVDYAYDKIGKLVEDKRQRPAAPQPRAARIRGRHRDRRIHEDAAVHRARADRLHGHEPRRRDGVQDRVRISRPARHDRVRAGGARIPAAASRRHRAHQSGDRSARRRAHADARAGEGASADHRGRGARAHGADHDADLRAGPQHATSCRAFSASATTCWSSSARRRAGRPTSTTCTASSMCGGTGRASTRPTRCSGRRSRIRSRSSTAI